MYYVAKMACILLLLFSTPSMLTTVIHNILSICRCAIVSCCSDVADEKLKILTKSMLQSRHEGGSSLPS